MKSWCERFKVLIGRPGTVGIAALVLLFGTVWFHAAKVKPLQARLAQLEEQLERRARGEPQLVRASTPGAKLAAFYEFFDREQTVTDWLAQLHAIGRSVGVEIQSADYRLTSTGGRLDRYQMTLPVKGTSAQIRAFADNALGAIPVASLDQVVFRRKRITEFTVEADIGLSLYQPRR